MLPFVERPFRFLLSIVGFMKSHHANLLLLLMGVIWGLGFAAQSSAMDDIGPILFVGLRFALAAAALAPMAVWESRRSAALPPGSLRRFAVLGSVFFVALSVQQVGLLTTTITNAGFLTTLYVILVPAFSLVIFGEKPALLVWPAAVLSLLGVLLLSAGNLQNLTWGDGLVIGGAFVWAMHAILVGRYSRFSDAPLRLACIQFAIAGGMGLVGHAGCVIAGFEKSLFDWPAIQNAGPEILYAGLVSGGLAFTLQAIAQRYTTPSVAVILMSTESFFAALAGYVLLGERIAAIGYVGGGLIVASVVMVELVSIRRDRKAVDGGGGVENL